jgi:hypothetical protein
MKIVVAALSLLILGVAGCTSADSVYRGIYEGLQVREELVNPSPAYRATDKRLGYWEYEAERKRLLNEGPSK